jgi:hypothetical protein
MRVWIGGLALLASCYSPTALPGSPCSPTAANCPETQTCALVAGTYVCVTGPVADAALDGRPVIDAPPDTAIDAVPVTPWSLVQTAESRRPGASLRDYWTLSVNAPVSAA